MVISVYFLFNINEYLLSTYSAPHTVLGSRDTAINKQRPWPSDSHMSHARGEGIQKADEVIYCPWHIKFNLCGLWHYFSMCNGRSAVWARFHDLFFSFTRKMQYSLLISVLFWGWLLGFFGSFFSSQCGQWLSGLQMLRGNESPNMSSRVIQSYQVLPYLVPFKVNSILL